MNKTGKILACIELAFYWMFIGRWSMGEDGLQARGSWWCRMMKVLKRVLWQSMIGWGIYIRRGLSEEVIFRLTHK